MSSQPLYHIADLRRIETAAREHALMQRAGRAVASLAVQLIEARSGALLILAGPGNNGGDAFVLAHELQQKGFSSALVFLGSPDHLPPDAAQAWRNFTNAGGQTLREIPAAQTWALIIDGLFGIGVTRAIDDVYAELINAANALAERDACPVLALDIPSGLAADTGTRYGATIRASHTLSFIGHKPGLFTADGPDYCGEILLDTLDLMAHTRGQAPGRTISPDLFSAWLKPRSRNSHKGVFGNTGILGGAPGMGGAAILAARAALRLGSGRVFLGLLDANAPSLDFIYPELMQRRSAELFSAEFSTSLSVLACGPGLGQSSEALALLEQACALDIPLILDADALNLVAASNALQTALEQRNAPTLMTPHPSEAARLLACSTAAVQADRIGATRQIAARYHAWVVLKGGGSIVCGPDPQTPYFINTSGNPGLATAGSGDVLTGLLAALLAQNWPPQDALLAAVHLHGVAADDLVAQGIGPIGLSAGELIDSARQRFNRWCHAERCPD